MNPTPIIDKEPKIKNILEPYGFKDVFYQPILKFNYITFKTMEKTKKITLRTMVAFNKPPSLDLLLFLPQ